MHVSVCKPLLHAGRSNIDAGWQIMRHSMKRIIASTANSLCLYCCIPHKNSGKLHYCHSLNMSVCKPELHAGKSQITLMQAG